MTVYPADERSRMRCWYFSVLYKCSFWMLDSYGTVSSTIVMVFACLLIITRSGRWAVGRMSGGIVADCSLLFVRSDKTSVSGDEAVRWEAILWMT